MTKRILFIFTFSSMLFLASLAQEKQLDSLVKKFDAHRVKAVQEKIYAHLDRTFYLTGETLWFKVYNVDASFHRPLNISRVAYVEILDKGNLSVLQTKIALQDGSGNGSFFLPASLNSGNYTFRVYTNWMKNFNADFFFEQHLTLVNPFIKPTTALTNSSASYSAAFFPEGGNLVSGIKSKIAFRITNGEGKGALAKGFVLNSRNDTLTSFIPKKFGIGNFLFTPEKNEQYKVILKDVQGRTSVHTFPEVRESGYVLEVSDSGEFVTVNITASATQGSFIYLFVHARQIIANASLHILRDDKASVVLRKNDLPEGISHITLFNEQLQPLCERLFFTHPKRALDIQVENNLHEYNLRRRVSMTVQTKTPEGSSTSANLSMSVYKIDSLPSIEQTGIFHHLWLGADLRGSIESPEYYFDTNNPAARYAMDNLMLTHGWRRFDWTDVLGENPELKFVPEFNGHIITGAVTSEQTAQRGILTYLASPGKIIRAYGSRSNQQGKVYFEIKDFYGPRQIIIQTADSSKQYEIKIENPFSSIATQKPLPPLHITESMGEDLLAKSIAMQIQDVYYYDQYGNRFIKPDIDSSAFYGEADATYFLDDYTRFQVMEEVMREYVPGVFVRKRKDGFQFVMVDIVNGGVLRGDPMVLLDGVPVFDVDAIMALDPLKVKKLEVVKRQYYLGPAVFPGIVSYTSYLGDLGGLELDPQSISLNYDGLQLKREFYSPAYENDAQRNNRLPDQRHLLYWNPDITTDELGKQQIQFYTSDVEGKYMVVIEGLDGEGFSGSKVHTFSVRPMDNQ